MNLPFESYLNLYQNIPQLSRDVVNVLAIKFSGLSKYTAPKYLQEKINHKTTQKEFENVLNTLVKMELITLTETSYDVPFVLKLELFPKLMKDTAFVSLLKKIQTEHNPFSYTPVTEYIRDFLFGYYIGETKKSNDAVERLIYKSSEAAPYFSQMLEFPEFDQVLIDSPILFNDVLDSIQLSNVLAFNDFGVVRMFFERNPTFNGMFDEVAIHKAEMLFHQGKLDEPDYLIKYLFNTNSLLLKSQIELFRGNHELSVSCYEKAQVTNRIGMKCLKKEFHLYYEFMYWLNFALNPKIINPKKLDVAINKCIRSKYSDDHFLLTLLNFLKNDTTQSEARFKQINTLGFSSSPSFRSVFYVILNYLINGELSASLQATALITGTKLQSSARWLFLREIIFLLEKADLSTSLLTITEENKPDAAVCLLSRISIPEKWEQLLDGLLSLTKGKTDPQKKEAGTSRVCYSANMDKGIIQPILQTMNAKGIWSAGRNIAMKRFKDQQVEGMTEQDRKVAATVSSYAASYYGSTEYELDFNKAIAELCGHPYLFLYSNPSVSVELVKAQPEISTEIGKFGIRLRTNVTSTDQRTILIKETQTRYKLISLSPQQLSIIRMINQGLTGQRKGKTH